MPAVPHRFKWLAVLWALLIGAGLVVFAGSIMLPSTKRARVDWDELRRRQQLADESETQPTSAPTSAPAPGSGPTPSQ